MNGTNIKIFVEDSGTPGTYNLVASQRDATLNETTDPIDESSKDSRNYKGSAGRYTATIDFDGLYVPDDSAYGDLEAAMRNGTLVKVQMDVGNAATDKLEAEAIVTTLNKSAPDQAEALVTGSLQITGDWTVV